MSDAIAPVVLVGVVGCALAVQLIGEWRHRRALVLASKPLASLGFVVLGCWRWQQGDLYGAWVLVGLFLSLWGDVLLMFGRAFLAGLVAFLLAHLAYLAAFHSALPARAWPVFLAWPVVALSVLVSRWLWSHLGSLRQPVLAYIVVITVMVWGAMAVVIAGAAPRITLIAALLFYLSDVAVARDRFVTKAVSNRTWGLPAYYAGQVLFALSVGA